MNEGWESDGDYSQPIKSQSYSNQSGNRNRNELYRDNDRGRGGDGRREDRHGGGGERGGYRNDRRDDNDKRRESGLTIQVDRSKLGKLIGRGGSQIKELQDKSGASINVSKLLKCRDIRITCVYNLIELFVCLNNYDYFNYSKIKNWKTFYLN